MTTKNPKYTRNPSPQKRPIINATVSDDADSIYWSFAIIDINSRWGFHKICQSRLHTLITTELKNKEDISWGKLKENGSHSIEKKKLAKEAQKRLMELELDDHDKLFSLRFTGKERVWGLRHGNVFKVLWWDPEHEICPSSKKNT